MKRLYYFLYYHFAIHLPESYSCPFGKLSMQIRYQLCKRIFKTCGEGVNIEHGANFGRGDRIEIGDNSGLGINCVVPNGAIIGKNVMMGPNCFIVSVNHRYDDVNIPMNQQGVTSSMPVIIEDDVWIGRDVTIMRGRHIKKGSVIAACTVLTKDFPEYSVVGGNPSRVIKNRLGDNNK